MRETWSFYSAGQILFGRNAVRQVGEVVRRHRVDRLFLVTDAILAKLGIVETVVQALTSAQVAVEVFDQGEPEPSLSLIRRCVQAAQTFRPNGVLGLGGGSNMDAAKLTAALLTYPGDVADLAGEERLAGPILPVFCVPTTSGTGSEVSAAAVYTDTDRQIKVGVLSNWLRPTAAIVDPLLTVSCPPKVSADSGIDALTHAIEAFTAVDNAVFPLPEGERSVYQGRHPFGDMVAEKAIRLIGRYLRRVVQDGHDLEARENMALAATLAGLAFSNVGVALVHAMEYPVGGAVHVSHGAGNGLLLPYVMRYNLPGREAEFACIAQWLGEDVQGLPVEQAAPRAIVAVERLRADIGIPNRLRDLGVTEAQLRPFAEKASAIRRVLRVNPRYPTLDDIEAIYRSAW